MMHFRYSQSRRDISHVHLGFWFKSDSFDQCTHRKSPVFYTVRYIHSVAPLATQFFYLPLPLSSSQDTLLNSYFNVISIGNIFKRVISCLIAL